VGTLHAPRERRTVLGMLALKQSTHLGIGSSSPCEILDTLRHLIKHTLIIISGSMRDRFAGCSGRGARVRELVTRPHMSDRTGAPCLVPRPTAALAMYRHLAG
jgi:hypothetical protein